RDAQFPANVLHLHAGVGLFERVDDLFLGVPALPHEPYPTRLGSRFAWSTFWGQGQSQGSLAVESRRRGGRLPRPRDFASIAPRLYSRGKICNFCMKFYLLERFNEATAL